LVSFEPASYAHPYGHATTRPGAAGDGVRPLLLTRLRRLAQDPRGGFRGVDGVVEGGAFDLEAGAVTEAGAEVVEGDGKLRAIAVGRGSGSELTSFLDGIQRACVRLYHGPVPIVHAYAAAVVRVRRGRRMETLRGAVRGRYHEERELVLFPFRYVDPEAVAAAGIAYEEMQDTNPPEEAPLPLFPPALHARAAEAVDRCREALERRLAEQWCDSGDDPGWLLVDGSLTLSPKLAASPRAIGLVKSHRTRFFDGDDARVLLGLRAGERTSVFRPQTRQVTPVYSWYLRLRSPAGRDVFWGLVRVEAAATESTLERVDEISRWLLAETAPLTLPDARWDRLIYPIYDCETYLRARAPNWNGV